MQMARNPKLPQLLGLADLVTLERVRTLLTEQIEASAMFLPALEAFKLQVLTSHCSGLALLSRAHLAFTAQTLNDYCSVRELMGETDRAQIEQELTKLDPALPALRRLYPLFGDIPKAAADVIARTSNRTAAPASSATAAEAESTSAGDSVSVSVERKHASASDSSCSADSTGITSALSSAPAEQLQAADRKSTRLNSSHT